MKQISNSDEDDLCLPLLQVPSVVILRHLDARCLVAMVLLLVVLFTCGVDSGDVHAASQATFVPACTPSTDATSTPATPPSPTSMPILLPTPPLSPTPPSSPDQELIEKRVWHYIVLVFEGRCQEAYGMLSTGVRAQEPFNDFKQNHNYTLFKGCWTIDNIFVSQLNSQSGIVSIELTNVSCDDSSPIVYFDWILRLHLQCGQLVITSIGLYPTGVSNG